TVEVARSTESTQHETRVLIGKRLRKFSVPMGPSTLRSSCAGRKVKKMKGLRWYFEILFWRSYLPIHTQERKFHQERFLLLTLRVFTGSPLVEVLKKKCSYPIEKKALMCGKKHCPCGLTKPNTKTRQLRSTQGNTVGVSLTWTPDRHMRSASR